MYKDSSVYQIFHFQNTCICPSIGIVMQNTWKVECSHLYLALILPCIIFQSVLLCKNPPSHVLVHVPCFESVLHGEICTKFRWAFNFPSVLHDDAANFESDLLYSGNWIVYMQLAKYHTFKVFCMPMPILGQMQVLWKGNIR